MTDEAKAQPPYISFKTLVNLGDRLKEGIPPRIDKSVLSYLSSGYKVQTLTALRTLGLIDAAGLPSSEFQDFIAEPALRQGIIAATWRGFYADVFSNVDVARATADQLAEAFTGLGLVGDTRAKAMIFFVHGAKFADIPVSALITNGIKRVPGTGRVRRRRDPNAGVTDNDGGAPELRGTRQDDAWQGQIEPVVLEWLKRIPAKGKPWPKVERTTWNGVLLALLDGIHAKEDGPIQ